MDQNHIIKLDKCSDRQFICPIVITVKKDQTVKLALDSKKINKIIHKNKYQMPNIEMLLDNIAQVVNQTNPNKHYSQHSTSATHIHKSLWIKQQENNATLVLLVVTPLGTISFKLDFMSSRICQLNSKSDRSNSYKLYQHLCLFGRYSNRNKRIFGSTQTKVTFSFEKTGWAKACDIIGQM